MYKMTLKGRGLEKLIFGFGIGKEVEKSYEFLCGLEFIGEWGSVEDGFLISREFGDWFENF